MSIKKKRGKRRERSTMSATLASPAEEMASVAALGPGAFGDISVKRAVPRDWDERAKKALQYYLEEPIVANAINAWRTFAIGDEVTVTCDDTDIQAEAREAFRRLKINEFVRSMILQLLVKGDAIGFVVPDSSGQDLKRVICVNPISVRLKYENDELALAVQRISTSDNGFGPEKSLALNRLHHVKWNAPEFEPRGNSMILPAFEAIELLRDYRRAERAIAKRWTTPLRFIQVGGHFGGKMVTPTQPMLEAIRDRLERADMESGLVVPFYVKAETYGADGVTLNTEAKVRETKEDIMIALGMARSIISGDGPNFATASISMQKMQIMLKEIKQAARGILEWVFDDWKERRGFERCELHFSFNDLDLNAEVDQRRLLVELYDRGLISKASLQQKMGLSPDVEERGRQEEEIVVDRNWTVQEISQLVALEVLTVDEARERLGMKRSAEEAHREAERLDAERLYARNQFEEARGENG